MIIFNQKEAIIIRIDFIIEQVIKEIKSGNISDIEAIEDFKKESLIWTELKHPNIVEALGLDIIDGRLFIIR